MTYERNRNTGACYKTKRIFFSGHTLPLEYRIRALKSLKQAIIKRKVNTDVFEIGESHYFKGLLKRWLFISCDLVFLMKRSSPLIGREGTLI